MEPSKNDSEVTPLPQSQPQLSRWNHMQTLAFSTHPTSSSKRTFYRNISNALMNQHQLEKAAVGRKLAIPCWCPFFCNHSFKIRSFYGDRPALVRASRVFPLILAMSNGGDPEKHEPGGGTGNSSGSGNTSKDKIKGRVLLALVSLLYGTLHVSLRLVYKLDVPPSAAALSASRGWMASLCFLPLILVHKKRKDSVSGANATLTSTTDTNMNTIDTNSFRPILIAAAELAVWNFLSQGLINLGLISTGAARAAFLTQISVIVTPVISLFAGQAVASSVWLGCALALCGLTVLSGVIKFGTVVATTTTAAVGAATSASASFLSTGDLLIVGGAFSWSFYLFRLSKIGSRFDEINLQALKTNILAILYSLWLAVSMWHQHHATVVASAAGVAASSSWAWASSLTAWGLLFYSALVPGMLGDVAQQQGQKHVSASEANVILSTEPVFAVLLARVLLGEVTHLHEVIGGGMILVAALIVAR